LKNNLILILKGIIIGIGKIIPGVSGSLIAISLNVYEKCISIISDFFSDIKNNIIYLGFLGIGILLSIILGSKLILILLNNQYFLTMSFIIGLISGIIPKLFNNIKINNKNFYIIVIAIVLFLFLSFFEISNNSMSLNYLIIFLLGIIEAITMIIPGISGTAIYILMGVYDYILELFSNPFNLQFLIFGLGLVFGVIVISKIMNYLFKNYKNDINLFITTITTISIFMLFKNLFSVSYSFEQLIIGIFLFIIGFIISIFLDR